MFACDAQRHCEFYLRYEEAKSELCRGLVSCYCQGPLWDRCARKSGTSEEGFHPDVRMMPSGELLD